MTSTIAYQQTSHATLATVVRAAAAFLALAACLPERAEAQSAVQEDASHTQRWLLEKDVVTVSRADSAGIVRRLVLPDGVFAYLPYAPCPPAMILDKSGAAIISSNVLPILWRVDPQTFQVQRYELELDHDGGQDVAFSALVAAPEQGILYATSATMDALWRIDLGSAKAQRIALPIQHRCSVKPLS